MGHLFAAFILVLTIGASARASDSELDLIELPTPGEQAAVENYNYEKETRNAASVEEMPTSEGELGNAKKATQKLESQIRSTNMEIQEESASLRTQKREVAIEVKKIVKLQAQLSKRQKQLAKLKSQTRQLVAKKAQLRSKSTKLKRQIASQ